MDEIKQKKLRSIKDRFLERLSLYYQKQIQIIEKFSKKIDQKKIDEIKKKI